jgi:hypothetical protein
MRHAVQDTRMRQMMELHERMLADPVIHERIMADTAMRRMVHGMMGDMTGGHEGMAGHAGHEATRSMTPAAKRGAAKPTSKRSPKPAKKKPAVTKPAPDPHAGHTMPMPPAKPTKPTTEPVNPHAGHTGHTP